MTDISVSPVDVTRRAQHDRAAFGRVLDGIVDKVRNRLRDQFAVAQNGEATRHIKGKIVPGLLAHRLVQFRHVGKQLRQVERLESAPAFPPVCRRESERTALNVFKKLVGIRNRLRQRRLAVGQIACLDQRSLQPPAHAGQRQAQIVGNGIAR